MQQVYVTNMVSFYTMKFSIFLECVQVHVFQSKWLGYKLNKKWSFFKL